MQWSDAWLMDCNIDKCRVIMHVGYENIRHEHKISGKPVLESKSEKVLKVKITKDLIYRSNAQPSVRK